MAGGALRAPAVWCRQLRRPLASRPGQPGWLPGTVLRPGCRGFAARIRLVFHSDFVMTIRGCAPVVLWSAVRVGVSEVMPCGRRGCGASGWSVTPGCLFPEWLHGRRCASAVLSSVPSCVAVHASFPRGLRPRCVGLTRAGCVGQGALSAARSWCPLRVRAGVRHDSRIASQRARPVRPRAQCTLLWPTISTRPACCCAARLPFRFPWPMATARSAASQRSFSQACCCPAPV